MIFMAVTLMLILTSLALLAPASLLSGAARGAARGGLVGLARGFCIIFLSGLLLVLGIYNFALPGFNVARVAVTGYFLLPVLTALAGFILGLCLHQCRSRR
jgi:hypothetical protein